MSDAATVEPVAEAPAEAPAENVIDAQSGEPTDLLSAPEPEGGDAEAEPKGEDAGEPGEAPSEAEKPVKAEEAKADPKDAEPKDSNEAEQPISYEAIDLPEGIEVANPERFQENISAFDTKFADLEKKFGIDHEEASAFRKEALNLAFSEIQRVAQQAQEAAGNAIEAAKAAAAQERIDKIASWRQAFEDSDLSGNRRQTTLDSAESVIREFAGDEKALRAALQETGMANHPAMIRLLSNVGSVMQEGRLVAAQMPSPTPKSKAGKLYGA